MDEYPFIVTIIIGFMVFFAIGFVIDFLFDVLEAIVCWINWGR